MPLIRDPRVSAAYKSLLALIGWVSIVATTGLIDGRPSWNALEMFTTQSNILCTLYFAVAAVRLWAGRDRSGVPFAPVRKGVATMGVTLTLLVAWLVLHMSVGFDSAASASLLGLHVVVPLMAIADWLMFDAPGGLRWRDPWLWLAAPLGYLAEFVIVLALGGSLGAGAGAVGGVPDTDGSVGGGGTGGSDQASRAPYPFLDVGSLGIGTVVLNVAALAAAVVALGTPRSRWIGGAPGTAGGAGQ